MRSNRQRLLAVFAFTAFFVVSATNVGLADPRVANIRPSVATVSTPSEIAGLVNNSGLSTSPVEQHQPFDHPVMAYTGLGASGRVAANPVPEESGEGRRIVYSVSAQRVWLIEADTSVLDTYLVSGRRNSPRPGTYRVFSKSLNARAARVNLTMKYMVRFTRASSGLAIGFHDLPRYSNGEPMQILDQLGTYRSGGCVRQSRPNAERLYQWAPIGTTVVVLR